MYECRGLFVGSPSDGVLPGVGGVVAGEGVFLPSNGDLSHVTSRGTGRGVAGE